MPWNDSMGKTKLGFSLLSPLVIGRYALDCLKLVHRYSAPDLMFLYVHILPSLFLNNALVFTYWISLFCFVVISSSNPDSNLRTNEKCTWSVPITAFDQKHFLVILQEVFKHPIEEEKDGFTFVVWTWVQARIVETMTGGCWKHGLACQCNSTRFVNQP